MAWFSKRRFTHINDTIEVCLEAWKKMQIDITVLLLIKLFNNSSCKNVWWKDCVYTREERRTIRSQLLIKIFHIRFISV